MLYIGRKFKILVSIYGLHFLNSSFCNPELIIIKQERRATNIRNNKNNNYIRIIII